MRRPESYQFLTGKPLLYVANVGENELEGNPLAQQLIDYAKGERHASRRSFRQDRGGNRPAAGSRTQRISYVSGIKRSGLDQLVRAAQKLLHLMTFFTSGPDESRAWSIEEGTTAVKAAGKIHSDIERGFIRAEIYSYEDIVKYRTEAVLKEKGLIRLEGKEYIMKDIGRGLLPI